MNYQLTIKAEDYSFVCEAIKLHTISMLESFHMQVQKQLHKEAPKVEPVTETLTAVQEPVRKKRVVRKKKAAPYGYKADGTPKKAAGRPKK